METEFTAYAPAARLPRLLAMLNRQAAQQEMLRTELRETQRKLLATQLRLQRATRLALHDTLTGLPNRMQFRGRLRQAVDGHRVDSREFALIYIDLDDFKSINDTHGHAVGDLLLQVVGRRLSRALRQGDSVSRLGGDEFVCLVRGVSREAQVQDIAGKLHEAIASPCVLLGVTLSVCASMGIALYPRDGANIESLMDSADRAMFRTKRKEPELRSRALPAAVGRIPA